MPIITQITGIARTVKGIITLMAVLPGVTILTGLIPVPPEITGLVKFISFFIILSCVISIFVIEDIVCRARSLTIAIITLALVGLGSASAVYYLNFVSSHIIVVNDAQLAANTFLIPLKPSHAITDIITPFQGNYLEALESSAMRFHLADLLQEESAGTVAMMVTLLATAQLCLTAAVVLGALKVNSSQTPNLLDNP